MDVLVTGGAGFIGSHLVDALVGAGARVRILDDLSSGSEDNLNALATDIEFVVGDIRNLETCRNVCRGVELVFHQAARGSVPRSMADPCGTLAINAEGSANIFRAALEQGARRTVYASSSSVYGDEPELPKREGREGAPLSPYALSKKMMEDTARTFHRCYGQELVGLRYFNVYGPRQSPAGEYAAVIPRFLAAYLSGTAPTIYGDGEQSRDFTFVKDAVQANLLAAHAPASQLGQPVFNIAAGKRTTLNELAAVIRRISGSDDVPSHTDERAGDVRHSLADIHRATELLEYRPSTPLEEGLELTAAYYRARAA
ncbi:MAG: SDR family oxidoreductase [Acidobacteriota bacterium]|nr:SDR family oxidoreductase [Acidobacteriota bacterium]